MGVMYLDEYYFIKCEMVDNVLNSQLEEDTSGVQVTLRHQSHLEEFFVTSCLLDKNCQLK